MVAFRPLIQASYILDLTGKAKGPRWGFAWVHGDRRSWGHAQKHPDEPDGPVHQFFRALLLRCFLAGNGVANDSLVATQQGCAPGLANYWDPRMPPLAEDWASINTYSWRICKMPSETRKPANLPDSMQCHQALFTIRHPRQQPTTYKGGTYTTYKGGRLSVIPKKISL